MKNMVISASAGSGKTHRLAVEYISIIIKNLNDPDFHFDRILVVTFTKKASAEIRNKIFTMLDLIFIESENNLHLKQRADFINDLEVKNQLIINQEILNKLKTIYIKIKTQKDKVRISTIDSLINTVFKSMIAPIMKLSNYTVDETANFDIWDELFEELLKEENISFLTKMLEHNTEKDTNPLYEVFNDLIENRWIMHLLKEQRFSFKSAFTHEYITKETIEVEKNTALENFRLMFSCYCSALKNNIKNKMNENKKDVLFNSYFVKDGLQLLGNTSRFNEDSFEDIVNDFLTNGIFKLNKFIISIFAKEGFKIYDGRKISHDINFSVSSESKFVETQQTLCCDVKEAISIDHVPLENVTYSWSDVKKSFLYFVYYQYYFQEQQQILKIWEIILKKYDMLKLKSGKLTFSDISWYTYKYLYNPDFSMIDKEKFIVENEFYEFLAVRNQYLLIDEFQDTSFMQFMILAPMMKDLIAGNSVFSDNSVIIVGDEKQSIYGWRGGQKGLLNYMQFFLHTKVESLKYCYRSVPEIVNFVNKLFHESNFKIDYEETNHLPSFTNKDQNENFDSWKFSSNIISARSDETGSVVNFFENESSSKSKHQTFVEDFFIPALSEYSLGETAIIARKNEDIEEIAFYLAENNISFIMDSARSIFDHKIPNSIYCLMRYIHYNDCFSLLKFLNSDIIKMDAFDLKIVAEYLADKKEQPNTDSKLCLLSETSYSIMKNIADIKQKYNNPYNMRKKPLLVSDEICENDYANNTLSYEVFVDYKNPSVLCFEIAEVFKYTHVFPKESDIKNLHSFMNIIVDFLNEPKEYTQDLEGFLLFYKKMKKKKNIKQLSTQSRNEINLLTIHKSKGLGFDTVFVYFDSRKKNDPKTKLKLEYLIDKNFSNLQNVMITINYKPVLKEVFHNEYKKLEQKNVIEEMNNIYVAFTRAKTNLAIFWLYSEIEMNKNPFLINNKLTLLALNENTNDDGTKKVSKFTNIQVKEKHLPHFSNNNNKNNIRSYFDIKKEHNKMKKLQKVNEHINLKNMYLKKKNKLFGNAIHHYLSFVKYNTHTEHKIAHLNTIRTFGNILSMKDIDTITTKAKDFIVENPFYFSKEWDIIYTEFTIIENGHCFRVDRLMINTIEKKIHIIDYKTGQINDPNQIKNYEILVRNLPLVQKEKYFVSSSFASISIL